MWCRNPKLTVQKHKNSAPFSALTPAKRGDTRFDSEEYGND
jgi:hypothetical protein